MNTIYVGIDAGGTHTRAVAIDSHGEISGSSEGASINRNHHSVEDCQSVLGEILRDCIPADASIESILIGTSGMLSPQDKAAVFEMVQGVPQVAEARRVWIEHDTMIALISGFGDGPGIALIAGTGCACFGRNAKGDTWLTSGWGAILDDAGSAYWVGIQALRAAVRAEDGRGAATTLGATCFARLGLRQPREILNLLHNSGITREAIAELAPVVLAHAEAGDPAANSIVEEAVRELGACVRAVRDRLFRPDGDVSTVLIGGLGTSGGSFSTRLEKELRRCGVSISKPLYSPVEGAAREALRRSAVASVS